MKLELVYANNNYSSWSMRAWVLLRQAEIPFEGIQLKFHSPERAARLPSLSPSGLVPVLRIDGEPVWDTLAIAETLAELFPEKKLWPSSPWARRHARSASAEMHSGFFGLRRAMPMNIKANLPGKGLNPDSLKDIRRITRLWEEARRRFGDGGSLLYGSFTIADAMYAPVVTRFQTYGVDLPPIARAYCESVLALPSVREWVNGAKQETEFVPEDEPYAAAPKP